MHIKFLVKVGTVTEVDVEVLSQKPWMMPDSIFALLLLQPLLRLLFTLHQHASTLQLVMHLMLRHEILWRQPDLLPRQVASE
jgi:hypothetical protein